MSTLILAANNPEVGFGVAVLVATVVFILALLLDKKPDPKMIFLCSLWARWPR